MITDSSTKTPANIAEFNQIAGLVFAQLYQQFPSYIHIDRNAIAEALGAKRDDWDHRLPSGKIVGDQITSTIGWLNHQGYTFSFGGGHPAEHVVLAQKGLAALNAVPEGLSVTVGSSLVSAAGETGRDWSKIGDLVGGAIGGFTKSMTGG
jgi:hypothetical protein